MTLFWHFYLFVKKENQFVICACAFQTRITNARRCCVKRYNFLFSKNLAFHTKTNVNSNNSVQITLVSRQCHHSSWRKETLDPYRTGGSTVRGKPMDYSLINFWLSRPHWGPNSMKKYLRKTVSHLRCCLCTWNRWRWVLQFSSISCFVFSFRSRKVFLKTTASSST